MPPQIRLTKEFTDEERLALFGWGQDIFGPEVHRFQWRPKDWHFIVEEEGRPVSHVGVMETTVSAGGRDVRVGGLGGVVSVPEAQGRGNIHLAMARAAEFMRDELKVEFGMLFCLTRLMPFYERQGWLLLEDEVEFDQSDRKVISPFNSMVLPFAGRIWPKGRVVIGGLPW